MTKAIIFDLDDTLMDTTGQVTEKGQLRAIKAMVKAGLPLSYKRAVRYRNKLIRKKGVHAHHIPLMVKNLVKNPAEAKRLLYMGLKAHHTTPIKNIKPLPGTIKLLEGLRKKGCRLYIVSHGLKKTQMKKIKKLKIGKYFDRIFIDDSHDESFKEEFFEHIIKDEIENNKLKPEDIISVGNRIDSEIMLSNKLGLTTVLMVHGRYSKLKPRNKWEKPDFSIRKISDLLQVLKQHQQ